MTVDGLRVWARHLNNKKLEPSMKSLLDWMEEEIVARICSGAAIGKATHLGQKSKHSAPEIQSLVT